ncbi:MAG: class I SAM-dependent methyltransferase [Pirellulaceae bacterium]|nr:class I SAM-dependent methyltransferase [Pirellulaceae bacterium]
MDRTHYGKWLVGIIVFSMSVVAQAQDSNAQTSREFYLGRRVAKPMSHLGADWLIRAERDAEEDPSQMLSQLDLKPDLVVCDMGCGNGFYSLTMAEMVGPNGKVLAVDIQPQMLQMLSRRAAETKIDNIDMILGTVTDPKLPSGKVDLVLMVDVYHEFSHPQAMLAAIRKSLSPNGRIALVEYREEDPSVPIKPEHKMSKRQILKEYSANGFKVGSEYDGLPWQHLMFMVRDEAWKP